MRGLGRDVEWVHQQSNIQTRCTGINLDLQNRDASK